MPAAPTFEGSTSTRDANGGALPPLRLLLAAPRGFCAGVRRAIDAVRDALHVHGAPVYVRRAIVHNLDVVRELEQEGAIFIEELNQVPDGSVVIFSAHGVAPSVARDAEDRGLLHYDAVCPLVSKVHREVEAHHRSGRSIVVIGHADHPEVIGTVGRLPAGAASIVSTAAEIEALPHHDDEAMAYVVQTTYSVDDARDLIALLKARFSDLHSPNSSDICYATTNRQAAVKKIAAEVEAVIVVGDSFSSNACRLAEVAGELCGDVQRVGRVQELDLSRLLTKRTIGMTSAASTPEAAVQEIVTELRKAFDVRIEEVEVAREDAVFKRMTIG